MLALVNTPSGKGPVELRQVPEPAPALHEALVAVQAFSLNRGELRSFRNNEEGWIPGQDISGIVLRQAADGSGPLAGARIVALMDEFGWAERASPAFCQGACRLAHLPPPMPRIAISRRARPRGSFKGAPNDVCWGTVNGAGMRTGDADDLLFLRYRKHEI